MGTILDKYPNKLLVQHNVNATTWDDVVKANTGLTSQDKVLFRVVSDSIMFAPKSSAIGFPYLWRAAWQSVASVLNDIGWMSSENAAAFGEGTYDLAAAPPSKQEWHDLVVKNPIVSVETPIFVLPFALYSRFKGTIGVATPIAVVHEVLFYREEVTSEVFSEFLQMAYPIGP